MLETTYYRGTYYYYGVCDNNYELVFQTNYSGANEYRWHILVTEGADERIYYRKTDDDTTWTSPAYLTSEREDDNINLGFADNRLIAFWDRQGDNNRVLKWDEDLSAEINVSEYVQSVDIEKTDDKSANSATIVLTDKEFLFNPFNGNSLKNDYFAENNIIRIEKGNDNGYTPAFYGYIGAGNSRDQRGEQILYSIRVWDRSKNFFKRKVTTPLFENQSVSYIADYIATNYMGLSASEKNLPTITDTIPTIQFIDEYIMDILYKIYQAYNYFPYFDESGVLTAKLINYNATVDYTYYQDGTDTIAANKAPAMNIVAFDFNWDDNEIVNKVRVIGETATTEETTFPEEFMGFIQGAAGWFSKSNTFTFYFSGDKKLYCVNPRLVVKDSAGNRFFGGGESLSTAGSGKQNHCFITQKVTYLVTILYSLIAAALACVWLVTAGGKGFGAVFNPLAFVVATTLTIIGQVSNFYYEIYAEPVGEPIPETIVAEVEDTDLIAKYGEIELEIDNPLLDTSEKCKSLAENELQKAKWFRYEAKLTILSNMAHQVMDVIEVYNPTMKQSYKLYVREIKQHYTRGEEDLDELTCAIIL